LARKSGVVQFFFGALAKSALAGHFILMPRRSARSRDPLDERAALIHSARKILREAEHYLHSFGVQSLRAAQNLADAQELVTVANAGLAEAAVTGSAASRDDALHDLAAATDALHRAQQLAAELADLELRAQRQRDRAALHLRDAENSSAEFPPITPAS
jgi:hypothetical protein